MEKLRSDPDKGQGFAGGGNMTFSWTPSWAGEMITISDGSAVKVYPVGAGAWIWDEVATARGGGAVKANDIVKHSKPVDEEEAKLRFISLREPEKGRADIQLICDYRIKPIEAVEVGEIELAD